jgi:hypothetical protein
MKIFKFIIIGIFLLLLSSCSPKFEYVIEKVTKVEYVSKSCYTCENTLIIYTKDKTFIFNDIKFSEVTIGKSVYVYRYLTGRIILTSEKLK